MYFMYFRLLIATGAIMSCSDTWAAQTAATPTKAAQSETKKQDDPDDTQSAKPMCFRNPAQQSAGGTPLAPSQTAPLSILECSSDATIIEGTLPASLVAMKECDTGTCMYTLVPGNTISFIACGAVRIERGATVINASVDESIGASDLEVVAGIMRQSAAGPASMINFFLLKDKTHTFGASQTRKEMGTKALVLGTVITNSSRLDTHIAPLVTVESKEESQAVSVSSFCEK